MLQLAGLAILIMGIAEAAKRLSVIKEYELGKFKFWY
jgi:hypothetical protein